MKFSADEQDFLDEMRKLSTDNKGNVIFVGLTLDESQEYYRYTRPDFSDRGNSAITDRYLELHDKHERARFAVLGAEMAARDDKSPRH